MNAVSGLPVHHAAIGHSLEDYNAGSVLDIHNPVVRMLRAQLTSKHHAAQDGKSLLYGGQGQTTEQ